MGMTTTQAGTFTEAEATDEMVLLFTRKLRRLHPEAFADLWERLPEGAHRAVYDAERRADEVRNAGGKTWAEAEEFDADGE